MVTKRSRRPASSTWPAAAVALRLLALSSCLVVFTAADDIEFAANLVSLCSGAGETDSGPAGEVVGCRLWRLCQNDEASGDYCQPAALLATACAELSAEAECKSAAEYCSGSSPPAACKGYDTVPDAPPTMQLYEDVQAVCAEGGVDEAVCARCTVVQDTNNLQATLEACPDALGTIAYQCLVNNIAQPCERYQALCATLGPEAFPTLCSDENPRSLLAAPSTSSSRAETPAAGPAADRDAQTTSSQAADASSDEPCILDPTKAECADYVYPAANATRDVELMCEAMPNMVGCTLQSSCTKRGATTGYCSPFSLLADMCVDMPSMGGCHNYMALCGSSTSVVKQCTQERAVPGVLTTDGATQAVLKMCASHSMIGCDQCTDAYVNCPDPFGTLSKLCFGMSGMADCAPLYAMCQQASADFPDLCGDPSASGGESVPPMTMWFHQRVAEVILFREWVPRSTGAYVGSWIAIFIMAVFVQGLKALRTVVETRWVKKQRDSLLCHCGEPEPELPRRHGLAKFMTTDQLYRNLVRTGFTGLMVTLEYWLMLIVMIFNVGFFVSVVTGYMVGALLFGHVGEAAHNYQLPAGAKDGAASGPSVTAPIGMPPPDLTKNGCCSSECV